MMSTHYEDVASAIFEGAVFGNGERMKQVGRHFSERGSGRFSFSECRTQYITIKEFPMQVTGQRKLFKQQRLQE